MPASSTSPRIDPIELLKRFCFDSSILGSDTSLIPTAKLNHQLGARGLALADELKNYHPDAYGLTLNVVNETNPEDAYLAATAFGDGWSAAAEKLFSSIQFIPSPSGLPFLIPKMLRTAEGPLKVGKDWTLVYAKMEGGPNPYAPYVPDAKDPAITDIKDPRARKVILVWSLEGFDEYVYTCWAWG